MNKIEKIRQETERLKKENESIKCKANGAYCTGYDDAFYDLLSFIDTLSEEPDKSLEEEISRTYHDGSVTDTEDIDHVAYENIAHHFAEWQASQMPMPEDTVLFNKGVAEGRRLEREDMMAIDVFLHNVSDEKQALTMKEYYEEVLDRFNKQRNGKEIQ